MAAQGKQVQEWKGDIVVDDKDSQKTAAASSRGLAGLPERPEDMPQSTPAASPFMQEKFDMAKRDFQYCWRNSLTKDNFTSDIYFEDPISKYTNFTGYRANITFLRNLFAPIYEIHDLRQSPQKEHEIWCKWTFSMQFWFNRYNPFRFIWDPRLVFTGTTILGVDPESGKFNLHRDYWDSNHNNDFFSFEAFMFVQRQLLSLSKPPDLATPEFAILKKFKNYELRRYKPFTVVEAQMESTGSSSNGADPVKAPGKGDTFKTLAKYLGRGNSSKKELSMTTPVFSSRKRGTMSFYVAGDSKELPQPEDKNVTLRQLDGGMWAACLFQGNASADKVAEKEQDLRRRLGSDGVSPPAASDEWVLAQYNVPWTLPFFKRNEVLIPVDESKFKLWAGTGFPVDT